MAAKFRNICSRHCRGIELKRIQSLALSIGLKCFCFLVFFGGGGLESGNVKIAVKGHENHFKCVNIKINE